MDLIDNSVWDRIILDEHLLHAAVKDPLSNYPTEQAHFIKYAPPQEIQAWRDYTNEKKRTNYNQYGASKTKTMRELGEVPTYIEAILKVEHAYLNSDRLEDKQRAVSFWRSFFKRNPLFATCEVI